MRRMDSLRGRGSLGRGSLGGGGAEGGAQGRVELIQSLLGRDRCSDFWR